jgi:hypothetical protein
LLFDLKQPFTDGGLAKAQPKLEKIGGIEVEASVLPAGTMGPHGLDHEPRHDDNATKNAADDGKLGHKHTGHH